MFFELLRIAVAIGEEDTPMALSRIPTQKDWGGLYAFAKRHSILGVIFSGMERLPKEQLPERSLLMAWYGQTEYLVSQNELLDRRAREVSEFFAKVGMGSCVLKGQGVARLYPNPRRRSSGDIDLWVNAPRRKILQFVREHWAVGDVLMYHVDTKVFDDTVVEVHYVPAVSYNPFRYRKYCKYFEKEGKVQFQLMDESLGFAYPTLRFNAVFSLIHIYNHTLSNEVKLKQIVDYYYILSKMVNSDRYTVMKTLKWMGLERFSGALMYVLAETLGLKPEKMLCTPEEKAGRQLLVDIMTGSDVVSVARRGNRLTGVGVKIHKLSKYIRLYPSEVLWAPVWKLWHWWWMKRNN